MNSLALLTLDLPTIIFWLKVILGLLAGGGITAAVGVPAVKSYLSKQKAAASVSGVPAKDSERNSDASPPVGFREHVRTILAACPYAKPAIQLSYLEAGFTEAETLKAEVQRMGGGTPAQPAAEEKKEVTP